MLQNSLRSFQIRIYCLPIPGRIRSYVVRKDDFYTIIIDESLSPSARMKAYRHELEHIENGDFDSDESTGIIEIRAHKKEDMPRRRDMPSISDE